MSPGPWTFSVTVPVERQPTENKLIIFAVECVVEVSVHPSSHDYSVRCLRLTSPFPEIVSEVTDLNSFELENLDDKACSMARAAETGWPVSP